VSSPLIAPTKTQATLHDCIEINVKGKWITVPALTVGGKSIVARGKWIKVALIHDEEWLETPEFTVAYGFVSPFLKSMGETEIIDELRVIIHETKGVTAYFTFSSQMRPSLHQFRIYGPRNGFILDQDQETLIKLRGKGYKSYLEKFVPPVQFAGQYLGNVRRNISSSLRNDFHVKSGLKCLIESFYRSITDGEPVPIPYREIILTARICST